MNHPFNNIRFRLYDHEGDEEFENSQWNQNGILVNYDFVTHGSIDFKKKTNNFEFIKYPVNPQQTHWKYFKLNKKAMKISEIQVIIENIYSTSLKIEDIVDVPDDNNYDTLKYIRSHIGTQCFSWVHTLGPNKKFKEIIEGSINGFKTYQLVFEAVDNPN